VAHPHAGDAWCIYPTYDYTHCLVDSFEHIDYSICTLEFETRRESYFWLLEALELYRPKVYEMSRLNITNTVLSKRKLLKLVNNGYMRGWDDPRMPTIKGLRRRGYNRDVINGFCKDVGVTRNFNTVQYERLEHVARLALHETSPRVMVVLRPIKIVLTNFETIFDGSGPDRISSTLSVGDFPFDLSRGSHDLTISRDIYIDAADFRVNDSPDYFGLAPGKAVYLKYIGLRIVCDKVDYIDAAGQEPVLLHCSLLSADAPGTKPKGTVHWVPALEAVALEVRLYDRLFTVEEPTDNWEKELNAGSEVVLQSLADPSLLKWAPKSEMAFQFERAGFFCVDKDSSVNKLVFNLTVGLKESKGKEAVAEKGGASKSRKEEQQRYGLSVILS
jgi:glutaminyl-tRNA synthetase